MEKLFKKADLIEMVADRVEWAKEVGIDITEFNGTHRQHFILMVNSHYAPSKAIRFSKAMMIEAINLLDEMRLSKI